MIWLLFTTPREKEDVVEESGCSAKFSLLFVTMLSFMNTYEHVHMSMRVLLWAELSAVIIPDSLYL